MVSVQYRETKISHAQILALQTTPVELVPAPRNGNAIVVHEVYLVADTASGVYAGGDNLVIRSEGAPEKWGGLSDEALKTGAPIILLMQRDSNAENAVAANVRVTLSAPAAPFAGGNLANTLSVGVWYSVVPAAPFKV